MSDIVEDLRLNHEYCPKEVMLKAADAIEFWREDSAAAWDKCEEHRLEIERLTKQVSILEGHVDGRM